MKDIHKELQPYRTKADIKYCGKRLETQKKTAWRKDLGKKVQREATSERSSNHQHSITTKPQLNDFGTQRTTSQRTTHSTIEHLKKPHELRTKFIINSCSALRIISSEMRKQF